MEILFTISEIGKEWLLGAKNYYDRRLFHGIIGTPAAVA
jgi:hypothetical protein